MGNDEKLFKEIVELVSVWQEKCPLASTNTFDSLKKSLVDESIEARMAVDKEDWEELKEELGDVLWDVLAFCVQAEKENKFTTKDVLETLKEKIKRRNPHVFGNAVAKTKEEVRELKQKIKQKEKQAKGLK